MKKVSCPSCGGNLELPEHLAVAHCVYCGGKILLSDEAAKERVNLSRYSELLGIAVAARNYDEMMRYADAILEIDQANTFAWVQKAVATFWLTLKSEDDAWSVASAYLDKAESLEPENDEAGEARFILMHEQAEWYHRRGVETGREMARLFAALQPSYNSGFLEGLSQQAEAKNECRGAFIAVMNFCLAASNLFPEEVEYLSSIDSLAKSTQWVRWPRAVENKQELLGLIQRRARLRKYLRQAEQQAATLQEKGGLFLGMRLRECQLTIDAHKRELALCDQEIHRLRENGA